MKGVFSSHPQVAAPRFVGRIEEAISDLPKQEAKVAQYLLLNGDDLSFQTGASIAEKTGTSEVTVSRLLHRLGYRGMPGLKREIQAEREASQLGIDPFQRAALDDSPLKDVLDAEMKALVSVFQQFRSPLWPRLVEAVRVADCVYVTGFQTVRGIAEDFTRRLSLARDDVRFLAAHDSMLTEWIGLTDGKASRRECMVIIDVVPYAREAPLLAELSKEAGRDLVVLTDELCHWAPEYTDLIVHAPSRSGLFVESTSALAMVLNMLVHGVAENDLDRVRERMSTWQALSRRLKIF